MFISYFLTLLCMHVRISMHTCMCVCVCVRTCVCVCVCINCVSMHHAYLHNYVMINTQFRQLKKVEERLKLVRSPNEEQFDVITAKLQEVYDEWSAEACGQQTVREKIVSDFQEFVQQTKGCEGVLNIELFVPVLVSY